jgi:predicted RNA binding protein YcfA (HicA-like mRNA interferase family)
VPDPGVRPGSFVIAGSGEAPEGKGNYRDHAIRPGDVSPEGLREKAVWVFGEMERRMAALGFNWADTTGSHVYTVHDIHPPLAAGDVVPAEALARGLDWHFARPPVQGLDYEMDARGVAHEQVVG